MILFFNILPLYYLSMVFVSVSNLFHKKKVRKFCFPFHVLEQVSAHFFSIMGTVNGSKYFRQCGPYGLCVATTVVLWYLQGTGFRIPTETRIYGCSSPLYKMAWTSCTRPVSMHLHPWIQGAVCTQLCGKAVINNKGTSRSDWVPIKL